MGVHKLGWMVIIAASVCMLSSGCQGPEGEAAATFPASPVLQNISVKVYGSQKFWPVLAKANPDFDNQALVPGKKITIPLAGQNSLGPLHTYNPPDGRVEHVVNIYIASPDREKLDVFMNSIRSPLLKVFVIPRSINNKIHSYVIIQAEPNVISDAINWRLDILLPLYSAEQVASGPGGVSSRPIVTSRNVPTKLSGQTPPVRPLPSWPAGSFKAYVVWEGDTIWEIAKKFYGSGEQWMLIAEANPTVDVNDLHAGQKLVIPPLDQPESRPVTLPAVLTQPSKPSNESEFQPASRPALQTSQPIAIASEPVLRPEPVPVPRSTLVPETQPQASPLSRPASVPAAVPASVPASLPASQPAVVTDKRTVSIVADAEELIAAIGSDRIIKLKEGDYELSSMTQRQMDHVLWTAVHDGHELTFRKVNNLRIEGPVDKPARLLVKPRYAYVLNFVDVEGLELANLILGHTEQPGFCTGGVLNIRDSKNIYISGCELFGCGTQGLSLDAVTGLKFEGSTIKKCTEGIMVASACRDLTFRKAKFINNEEYNGIILIDCRSVLFDDCLFSGNIIRGTGGRGILFDTNSCSDVAVKGGIIRQNVFGELVKPEKAAKFTDVKLEDNGKQ